MKRFKITDLLIGVLFTLLFISMAVVVTINFRPLYYLDISLLHIEETSGISRDEIKENYDALIDYSSPFYQGELHFPTLPASEHGLVHFEEVKNIFTAFYLMAAAALALGVLVIIRKTRRNEYGYLLTSSIMAIALPSLLALLLSIDFDRAFVVFHKLFFKNDYWLFDPATDPVILILPDTFFLHCALMIIALVILMSLLFLGAFLWKRKHSGIKYRRNKGLKL
ncbi:integral membrane protein (TIGR01906 family) [Anaerotaenia torta]|uniref:TIGR01906 family membrane protein n=1 Tax=Anaerotaenia torta TaxID=433293 RepID=UPI003D1F6BE3